MLKIQSHGAVAFLVVVIAFVTGVSPTRAQSWNVNQVEQFLGNSLPDFEGSVVSVDGEIFVDAKSSPTSQRMPVRIVRKTVSVEDGDRSLNERVLGQATLLAGEDGLSRLEGSRELLQRVRSGDVVRARAFTVYLRDQTNSWRSSWTTRLNQLDGIQQIRREIPPEEASGLVLTLNDTEMTLKKAGEWGNLARRTRDDFQRNEQSTAGNEPTLERIDSVDRILNDFDLVRLPDYPNIQLVVMASSNQLGLGRWKGEVQSLSWHRMNGELLSVIPLPDRMDGLEEMPVIVVRKEDNTIRTVYYQLDLTQRELNRRWSAKNTWIDSVSGHLYGWEIGLNEPFKNQGYRVEVKDRSWDWVDDRLRIPRLSVPTAVSRRESSVFRLNKDGNLDVFQNGERSHASSQVFGGHPISISARRAKTDVDRHPSLIQWQPASGNTRLIVGNNQTDGIPYFKGLQSYSESRLYVLGNRSDYLETIWESNRLEGYVAGVFHGKKHPWVITVQPSTEQTTIHQLNNASYKAPK